MILGVPPHWGNALSQALDSFLNVEPLTKGYGAKVTLWGANGRARAGPTWHFSLQNMGKMWSECFVKGKTCFLIQDHLKKYVDERPKRTV